MVKIKTGYTGFPSSKETSITLHNVDDLKKMECDDGIGTNDDTNGDFWKVFVR